MKYTNLNFPEVVLIEPDIYGDERDYFLETWRDGDFREKVANISFVQDNQSKSMKGTLRGMYYQLHQS